MIEICADRLADGENAYREDIQKSLSFSVDFWMSQELRFLMTIRNYKFLKLRNANSVSISDIKLIKCESNAIILAKCQEPSTKVEDVFGFLNMSELIVLSTVRNIVSEARKLHTERAIFMSSGD